MGKRRLLIAAVVVVLLGSAAAFLIFGGEPPVEAVVLKEAPYQERVVAVGQLALARETTLIAEVGGIVEEIAAAEGTTLTAGALLIGIEEGDAAYQLAEREAGYRDAAAQYESLVALEYPAAVSERDRLASLKTQSENAYRDAERLFREGAISESAMLQAKSAYESALSQWTAAQLRAEALAPGGPLRDAGASRLSGALAQFEKAQDAAEGYRVAVPWDAVILQVHVAPGDRVAPGQVLADIGGLDGYRVSAELDEKYVPYIRKGQTVRIYVGDASSEAAEAAISSVTPRINPNTGTFGIGIDLPADFPYRASNLTVNLEIALQDEAAALQLPASYLLEGPAGGTAVLVYESGRAVLRAVEVDRGLSNSVRVRSGLQAGDVVLSPATGLADGDRVGSYEEADPS